MDFDVWANSGFYGRASIAEEVLRPMDLWLRSSGQHVTLGAGQRGCNDSIARALQRQPEHLLKTATGPVLSDSWPRSYFGVQHGYSKPNTLE